MSNARENFIRIILKRSEKLESNLKLVLNRFHYHFTLDILQWIFIFYLSLKSETVCIRLPRKFHFSLQFHICMYFTYFSFNFDLKREFFYFLSQRGFSRSRLPILTRNVERITDCRITFSQLETFRQDFVTCYYRVCFSLFSTFSTRGENFSPLSLYLLLFFPRFFQPSESIKRNILIRVQRDSMLTRFLIVFLYSFVFLSFFFFPKLFRRLKAAKSWPTIARYFHFHLNVEYRNVQSTGSNRFVRFYFN